MLIDRAALAALLPHSGAMLLLDGVESWDAQRIICVSMQHRAADNPLRVGTRLSAIHAIEFAAQAMAAHSGLMAEARRRPRAGWLLSVRDCVFHGQSLDDIASPLRIEAEQMGSNEDTRLYRFRVSAQEAVLAEGRAAVMLRREAGP
jgi:predicted hotdog family 3-hydroxylacyl-ACP dehydratase